MARLVDAMKSETDPVGKLYELRTLAKTSNIGCLQEFVNRGGIPILVQWAKEIRNDKSLK